MTIERAVVQMKQKPWGSINLLPWFSLPASNHVDHANFLHKAGDPVSTGLVASLARPRGNGTRLSVLAVDQPGKIIELLREAVPGLQRFAPKYPRHG